MKALLKIGYYCNYTCTFCHAEEKKNIHHISLPSIFLKILLLKKKGVQTILLSGGESSLEKHFFQVIEFIRKHNLDFGIVTNGSTICAESFLQKLDVLGIKNIYLSLHGFGEVHNTIVGDLHSFDKIKNILSYMYKRPHIEFFLNYVVTKQNFFSIHDTVLFLSQSPLPEVKIKFSFLEPSGAGDNTDLFISPKVAANAIIQVFQKFPHMNLFWDGFPLCFFQNYFERQADLQTENIRYITEVYESKIYTTDYGIRSYHDACNSCKIQKNCYGIFSRYIEYFTQSEITKPLK